MSPRTGLRRSSRRTNPLAASPIIAVVGSLTQDIIFETERIPQLAYRASHETVKNDKESGKSGVRDSEIRVFMNGAVGDDEIGPALREKTGRAVVMVEQEEGQSSALGFKGTNLLFQPLEDGVECLAGDTKTKPDVLITHCTLRMETVENMLETAYANGVETILSASPAVYLTSATYAHIVHIVFNEHEAAEMSGRSATDFVDLEVAKEAAAVFVRYGVKYAIITLGEAGAVYATRDGKRGHVLAQKNVNLMNYCIDSFLGAYVVEFVRQKRKEEWNIEKAIDFTIKAAARTIEQLGSQTALPWADEIERD
ncbi:MAG: hypothetical protein Q9217_006943 [Psora testacea]